MAQKQAEFHEWSSAFIVIIFLLKYFLAAYKNQLYLFSVLSFFSWQFKFQMRSFVNNENDEQLNDVGYQVAVP